MPVVETAEPGTSAAAGVRAVERAIELLFRVAEHPQGATLGQLAQATGCSKSTAHRLLATLERLAVVERDPVRRQYRLGRRTWALAREGAAGADPRALALPYMRELRDRFEETVTLHLRDGDEHVIVEQCESPQEIRRILPLGQRIPLLTGATDEAGPSRQELDDIHSLGYAFSVSERVAGGSAISVPIHDRAGAVCAALSMSGPAFRFTPARAARCAPAFMRAAAEISAALGYSPSGGIHGDRSA